MGEPPHTSSTALLERFGLAPMIQPPLCAAISLGRDHSLYEHHHNGRTTTNEPILPWSRGGLVTGRDGITSMVCILQVVQGGGHVGWEY